MPRCARGGGAVVGRPPPHGTAPPLPCAWSSGSWSRRAPTSSFSPATSSMAGRSASAGCVTSGHSSASSWRRWSAGAFPGPLFPATTTVRQQAGTQAQGDTVVAVCALTHEPRAVLRGVWVAAPLPASQCTHPRPRADDESPWSRADLLAIYSLPGCASRGAESFDHVLVVPPPTSAVNGAIRVHHPGDPPAAAGALRLHLFDSGGNDAEFRCA